MDQNIKKNINTVGKIGRIIAVIMAVCMIILSTLTAFAAVYVATLPKELVEVTLSGTADVYSQGKLFGKIREVLDLEQDGSAAKLSIAGTGDVDIAIAGDDDILENADLTQTEKGIRVSLNDKKIAISMRTVLYTLAVTLVYMVCSVVVLFMIKSLMKAFETCDTPFSENIIRKMKNLGCSLIPFAVFRCFSDNSAGFIFSDNINLGFRFDLTVILGVLMYLALIAVFTYGAQLQKESDETL